MEMTAIAVTARLAQGYRWRIGWSCSVRNADERSWKKKKLRRRGIENDTRRARASRSKVMQYRILVWRLTRQSRNKPHALVHDPAPSLARQQADFRGRL
jgi:hypothetical protein